VPGSGPQIQVSLRLQFRDPDHAALIGADETRQQIAKRNILRFHGVAAGGKFNADFGELADMPAEIRVSRIRVKCPQRLAVHHKRDGDVVGPADAVEMILNVAGRRAKRCVFSNVRGRSIFGRGKRGERSIVQGAFRRRLERPVRMHAKRKSGAEQQQTNRAGKWPGPASGPIDQIAEHEG